MEVWRRHALNEPAWGHLDVELPIESTFNIVNKQNYIILLTLVRVVKSSKSAKTYYDLTPMRKQTMILDFKITEHENFMKILISNWHFNSIIYKNGIIF